MGLFSSSSPSAPAAVPGGGEIKDQIETQIKQELAIANATELVNKITENCFTKCIEQPQSSLTNPQTSCVDMCLQKYMRSWNVISKTYINRIQQSK